MASVGLQSLDEKALPSLGINTAMKTGRRKLVSPSLSQSCNSHGDGVRVVLAETRTRYEKVFCASFVRGNGWDEEQRGHGEETSGVRGGHGRPTCP